MLVAGLFLGGAIDHGILALRRSPMSPYHVNVGVAGNWALALLDIAVAIVAAVVALRIADSERRSARSGG
jgi:NO-binding membrane sensor protein with MHYT domain